MRSVEPQVARLGSCRIAALQTIIPTEFLPMISFAASSLDDYCYLYAPREVPVSASQGGDCQTWYPGQPEWNSSTYFCHWELRAHEYSILLGRGVLPFHSHSFQASSVGKRKITLYARARSFPASLGAKRACVPPLFRPETGRLARSGREISVCEEAALARPFPGRCAMTRACAHRIVVALRSQRPRNAPSLFQRAVRIEFLALPSSARWAI